MGSQRWTRVGSKVGVCLFVVVLTITQTIYGLSGVGGRMESILCVCCGGCVNTNLSSAVCIWYKLELTWTYLGCIYKLHSYLWLGWPRNRAGQERNFRLVSAERGEILRGRIMEVLFYRPTQGSNSMDHGKMTDEELGSLTIEITTFSRRSVVATWHRSESNKAKLVSKQAWWSSDDLAWHRSESKPGLMGFTTHDGQAMVKRWSNNVGAQISFTAILMWNFTTETKERIAGGKSGNNSLSFELAERRFIIILMRFCTTTAQLKREKRMEQEFEGKHWAGQ